MLYVWDESVCNIHFKMEKRIFGLCDLSHSMGKGRWDFQFSVWYPGVTTITQEAPLQTKLYLEFSGITEDGNFATS